MATPDPDEVASPRGEELISTAKLADHLSETVPKLLGGSQGAFSNIFLDEENTKLLARFIEDISVQTLFIQRRLKEEKEDDVEENGGDGVLTKAASVALPSAAFVIRLEIGFTGPNYVSVCLTKRFQTLTADKELPLQLSITTVADGQPYEAVHGLIHVTIAPFIASVLASQASAEKIGAKEVKKAIADFEMALTHLQQDVDMPDVVLTPHHTIVQVMAKAQREGRKAVPEDFQLWLEDPAFLNGLQKCVTRWSRAIQKVTQMERDPSTGTTLQEISFWNSLERSLTEIKKRRDSDDVNLTFEVLKFAKRYHMTVGFDTETGLTKALETAVNYNILMRDMPISPLLTANDLEAIRSALLDVFAHLRKIRNTNYPVQRALALVQALARDLAARLFDTLRSLNVMKLTFPEFEAMFKSAKRLFLTWDEEDEKFRNVLRDQRKKAADEAGNKLAIRRTQPEHKDIQDRLEQLMAFRKQHEQLRNVIVRVVKPGPDGEASPDDRRILEDVDLAYAEMNVDVLDLTPAGNAKYEKARQRYDAAIDSVETRMTARLREQLGGAENALTMFKIFRVYNVLFVRPRIRGAIREYQSKVIDRVKGDIAKLHEKFKVQYPHTLNSKMSQLRDLPPISGHIIWARSLERQLTSFLGRVESVLGRGWENHVEGRALKDDGDAFRALLNTKPLFESWIEEVQTRDLNLNGCVFDMEIRRGLRTQLVLVVNFSHQLVTLAKEVRNLKWLGYRVPLVVVKKANEASHLYPLAMTLRTSVRSYQHTVTRLAQYPRLAALVAPFHKSIQTLLSDGATLRWNSVKLQGYTQTLSDEVTAFGEKVEELISLNEAVDKSIDTLDSCPFTAAGFGEVVAKVQKSIDDLELRSFANVGSYVGSLNDKISEKLEQRLIGGVRDWCGALIEYGAADDKDDDDNAGDDDVEPAAATRSMVVDAPKIAEQKHEILIRNQVMYLNPPLEKAREHLLDQLDTYLSSITAQPRVHASHGEFAARAHLPKSATTYHSLLAKVSTDLLRAYALIDRHLGPVQEYVTVWLQYQVLWDLPTDAVVARLGDNLPQWQAMLLEIKKSRRTFDTDDAQRAFGPIVVNYAQVQSKVALKYDALHRDLLGKFGGRIGNAMQDFHASIQRARHDLEARSLDTASTGEAIALISTIGEYKRKMKLWAEKMESFTAGTHILERQRFTFPNDWLHLDNVSSEWEAFTAILSRKDTGISSQVQSLQMKVSEEDRALERKMTDLFNDWDTHRPAGGEGVSPDEVLNSLNVFESRFVKLREDMDSLNRAREALDLDTKKDDRLVPKLEELQDLKGTWMELSKVHRDIGEVKATPWSGLVPKKMRSTLLELQEQMKNLPARVRSYAAYEHTLDQLKRYYDSVKLLDAMRSDAVKDRHWKILMKNLNVNWNLGELSVGQVLDINPLKHQKTIEDVMRQAQGENGLEQYLREIREEWSVYEVELGNFQNKTKVIKGWDELFAKVRERIQMMSTMKASPFYKVFEEEASSWDGKLNAVNNIFDIWFNVQRKWVYLDGIFSGSADIKHLLPTETSKFASVSQEFTGLMKQVAKSPLVMTVIAIPNVQKSLERLSDLLVKIEKALTEYLERERSAFPRFYFIGNEDLLDIIGNSKNVPKLQRHFKNMFQGVQAIILPEEENPPTKVLGIASREGEQVFFKTPVNLKDEKVNVWLTNVEKEMKVSLARLLEESVNTIEGFRNKPFQLEPYMKWLDSFQAQIVVLSTQVSWSHSVHAALESMEKGGDDKPLRSVVAGIETTLAALADTVLLYQPVIRRKKLEQMITELVHQRDVTRDLLSHGVKSVNDFNWLGLMRFYFDPKQPDVMKQLTIHVANTRTFYGFEYLGLAERLVQTPLTDRCYLTMTQALDARQGGCPFGPAGTGKTESVKSLGGQLGRFVLVFNCDETFDVNAMGRIFIGLCQVGAWGCFDEFNRLEERQLSAVSQEIQSIQVALKDATKRPPERAKEPIMADIMGKSIPVHPDVGIFITMNPGYAGRSNLPDNLKKLFRNLAMTQPDRQLIAQVMLFSQGFRSAEMLARKIVPLFILCKEQLSAQSHYDFGLRSLKAVLVTAGNLKRERLDEIRKELTAKGEPIDDAKVAAMIDEQEVVIQSVSQSMIPKLVADDIPLLKSLMADVFPGVEYVPSTLDALRNAITDVCRERHFVLSEVFMTKMLQLYQVSRINHGVMLVGPPGSGKSSAWRILLEALQRIEKREAQAHVMDPKAITKDELYGVLDASTLEWTDGLFTHCVRKVIDNQRGELNKRQWIVFDGDVDPEWVENLNSVLDDNKLLTLPNGERLALPPNLTIIFEVQDLRNATLATVSRCGMVWFSEDVLNYEMYVARYLGKMRTLPLDLWEDAESFTGTPVIVPDPAPDILAIQQKFADVIAPHLQPEGVVLQTIQSSFAVEHIMIFSMMRCLSCFFALLNRVPRIIAEYNDQHSDFPMTPDQVERFSSKRLVFSILWAIVGDARGSVRQKVSAMVREGCNIPLPPESDGDVIDFEVSLPDGEWAPWKNKVPVIRLESSKMAGTDVVVPTLDTVRHEDVLFSWLTEKKPIILCGPPGSGKTMTLFNALRRLPQMDVAALNFSSATTPELILKIFEQYCEYRKTPRGVVLAPIQASKTVVVFMDECNLPAADKYSTVRVITFVRQLVEQNGFWRTEDHTWISLERIQFVGACNPPTDPGRVPLDLRFLRHLPVVYVDYPGAESLRMIYGTFTHAVTDARQDVKPFGDVLTNAMVDFFMQTQEHFTAEMQPHYIYSPREMTRWVKGVGSALAQLEFCDGEMLCRIWAHEALRLFCDRLVHDEERKWTNDHIDSVAAEHFGSAGVDTAKALARPILFTNWLTKTYISVDPVQLRDFIAGKLKAFCEEELDVPLVLFDDVLDHVLRIDRVFRQNQGHMLLIGTSGSGKTTLSRFIAWARGLSVVQVKAHRAYTVMEFDEDLRGVLRRAGTKGEKIVFMIDESNIQDTAFLERMNTLLANGEVPGLFEGDEYSALMTACKEASAREGTMLSGNDELYRWFSGQVMNNLHVVFTMNPTENGLQGKTSTSPALFNRCVVDWFGDWPDAALYNVAHTFTQSIELDKTPYEAPAGFPSVYDLLPAPPTLRDAVVNACMFIHKCSRQIARSERKRLGLGTYMTPRHYVEFINQYVRIYTEKRADLEEQQTHLNTGVKKIEDTVRQVEEMQKALAEKDKVLQEKNRAAEEKLKQMMKDQQAAEEKKFSSINLSKELEVKTAAANEKKANVQKDLSSVEPLLAEAKQAVEGVGPKEINEIKALANPPAIVKTVMESVVLLLGKPSKDWKQIKGEVVSPDFLKRVLNFDAENVTAKIRNDIQPYLKDPEYNEARANKASRAAGPLVKWVTAIVEYARIMHNIEPLRNELKAVEAAVETMNQQMDETRRLVGELEARIGGYKNEYAALIADAQAIKNELQVVSAKCERSVQLLGNLSGERVRWAQGSKDFDQQLGTVVGDSLLAGAFMAYLGYFDQTLREDITRKWVSHLKKAKIPFNASTPCVDYLSTPDDRLRWRQNSLPDDVLCAENAIMLRRSMRYPLIIDPSGQAVEFVMKEYADKKLAKTSFLDPNFRKSLESALRFGTPLLIQDAETYDPVMNPVLNKELRRVAGRVIIEVGHQEIDLSPAFFMMMTTRNPAVEFTPDLCSRVNLVNFTITRSSLQSQCLNQVLRAERPDVDKKRSDLLKLQGEFRLKLRRLEKDLLAALNEAKGSLLDDDVIIAKMEKLKTEAAEVGEKVQQTDTVMREIEATSQTFQPLAQQCAGIYFTLQQLHTVHFLYRYSLQFFFEIFKYVLTKNPHLDGVTDPAKRLTIISADLFKVTYDRVTPGMLNEHCVPLAFAFARLRLQGTKDDLNPSEVLYFLQGGGLPPATSAFAAFVKQQVITEDQGNNAHILMQALPSFNSLADDVNRNEKGFVDWVRSPRPEEHVPTFFRSISEVSSPVLVGWRGLLLLQAFRPDRLLAKTQLFIESVFFPGFLLENPRKLADAVEKEIDAMTPVLLCGVSGYDPSTNVRDLVAVNKTQCIEIALGAGEAEAESDKAIAAASKTGKWVMLKNVHLAPGYLVRLEKRLLSSTPSPTFRIFMTSEINPKLPVSLLQASRVFVFEPAAGIKANLMRTLQSFPDTMAKPPGERARIYFLLAWMHAVVQERLRYVPLGWSKKYEFGEADLRSALETIDTWVETAAQGRANVPPERIPWIAMQELLAQSIYGGRIDNETDQRLLVSFVRTFFIEQAYRADFALVPADRASDTAAILAPESTNRDKLLEWVTKLPEAQSPVWLGLPANAEMVLLASRAKQMVISVMKLQTTAEEKEKGNDDDDGLGQSQEATGQPAWMRQLSELCTRWMGMLPERASPLKRTPEKIKDPMFRFFEREVVIGVKLLRQVRHDIQLVLDCCAGLIKQTNNIRDLTHDLSRGAVPKSWKKYKIPDGLPANQWVIDLCNRLRQLAEWAEVDGRGQSLRTVRVWMGGLFIPEAFITATRQTVAQAHGWSLEKLQLELDMRRDENDVGTVDNTCFLLRNLRLDGAAAKGNTLEPVDVPFVVQPLVVLKWHNSEGAAPKATGKPRVELPVYLNTVRDQVIFYARFDPGALTGDVYYKRGVALLCASLSGMDAE